MSGRWDFWIDRGGTFTDVIGRDPDGALHPRSCCRRTPKPIATPRSRASASCSAWRPASRSRPDAIGEIKMGTTVATNALLERKGDRVLLLITKGFRDALRIAYQARPDIFAKEIILPELLYERVVEVDERVRADGTVETRARPRRGRAGDRTGAGATASTPSRSSSCMPGNIPAHEQAVARLCREIGLLAGLGQPRGLAAGEAGRPRRHHGGRRLSVADPVALCGAGGGGAGVTPAHCDHPPRAATPASRSADAPPDVHDVVRRAHRRRSVPGQGRASCPARPAASSAWSRRRSSPASTRSSASTWAAPRPTSRTMTASYERAFDTEVAGVRMRAPMMRIHTVAAGGGSILHFEAGRFRVGPDSAGANPGPACYRRGGPLAVTDANVMLGKLQPDFFPAIFGPEPGPAARRRQSCARNSRRSPPRSATAARRKRSPTASSPSPSRTWPTPSRRSRCSAATTSPNICSTASAAPAASMPAWSPTRSAWRRC